MPVRSTSAFSWRSRGFDQITRPTKSARTKSANEPYAFTNRGRMAAIASIQRMDFLDVRALLRPLVLWLRSVMSNSLLRIKQLTRRQAVRSCALLDICDPIYSRSSAPGTRVVVSCIPVDGNLAPRIVGSKAAILEDAVRDLRGICCIELRWVIHPIVRT